MLFAFELSESVMIVLPLIIAIAFLMLLAWILFEFAVKACQRIRVVLRLRHKLKKLHLTRKERKKIRKEVFRRLKAQQEFAKRHPTNGLDKV
ncbi:MAG: hypothetical protein NTV36_00960 [Candidatus Staskawiczbacteria bacterium]|nr:hypothetical protein [Candidatus Staskawiczbacteria bacterium]